MKKCKCNNIIPLGRVKLGYNTCINCSTTQQYSYVPIIANKQILEVQIVSQEISAMPCLKKILYCFALEQSAFKTKHLIMS